jgi:hypothetical protein
MQHRSNLQDRRHERPSAANDVGFIQMRPSPLGSEKYMPMGPDVYFPTQDVYFPDYDAYVLEPFAEKGL